MLTFSSARHLGKGSAPAVHQEGKVMKFLMIALSALALVMAMGSGAIYTGAGVRSLDPRG